MMWKWGAMMWKWGARNDAEGPSEVGDVQGAPVDHYARQADHSVPRAGDDVPAIFLSHCGKQKPFVENLYDALRSVNHVAFFDKHSLPKGSPFPTNIERAAMGCKLGVVVLSDDFLTSKWPMLELEMLVLKRGPNAKVLPLFYKLSPHDLKSRKNLSKWRRTWKKVTKQANQLDLAVEMLDKCNGEVFIQGASEAAYIKRVVSVICKLLPSPVLYDLSSIKGQDRLAEVVAGQFEEAARQRDTVCMVGVHGVGGLGKTTMCKIMGNFFNSQYPGKFSHIEFPNDGDSKAIVQECKKALKTLANLSDEHLLNKADDFDQIIGLMKEHLRHYDVFLAIDNVWEISREKAERILGVGFSANSKILLTSRSEKVLKDLLSCQTNTHLGPLPCPNHEEAFHIFEDAFGDCNSSVNRNQVTGFLKKCFFNGSYHALALKALSQHVKRVCELEDSHCLPHILEESCIRDLQSVDDVIKLNYKNLPEHKQCMFLDIVVTIMPGLSDGEGLCSAVKFVEARKWLSILYKEFSKNNITALISELASDGLIQLEKGESSKMMIRVHDLYSGLAKKEAQKSPRFFMDGSTRSVEKIEWERLERVILPHGCSARFVEKLQQQKCPNLQVLYGHGMEFQSGIDINLLPSLCILKLKIGIIKSVKNWSAATGLAILHLYALEELGNMKLSDLLKKGCKLVSRIQDRGDLGGLTELRLMFTLSHKRMTDSRARVRCCECLFPKWAVPDHTPSLFSR